MSSGSAAFKVATVAAVLALLVLPSFGSCPSPGPAPPPPAPAMVSPAAAPVTVAHAPGASPPESCSNCFSHCSSKCSASVAAACSKFCDPPASCEECRLMVLNNNCTTCDCQSACYVQPKGCQDCLEGEGRLCNDDCNTKCDAKCVKKIKKE